MLSKLEYRELMFEFKNELDKFSFYINTYPELEPLKEKYKDLLTKNYVFYLHSELALQSDKETSFYFANEASESTKIFKKLNEIIRGVYESV